MPALDIPQLSLLDDETAYTDGKQVFARVTSMIEAVLPPFLLVWGENTGHEAAHSIYKEYGYLPAPKEIRRVAAMNGWTCRDRKDDGAARGTALHTCLERYVKSGTIPRPSDVSPEHAPYVQSLARFLLDYGPEFEASELTVYHDELGYAGTLDACVKITRQPKGRRHGPLVGKRFLLDTKTNKDARVYFPQHHYQLAAYRLAWQHLGLSPLDGELVVAIGPVREGKGHYQVAVNTVAPEEFEWVAKMYHSLTRAKEGRKHGRNTRKG